MWRGTSLAVGGDGVAAVPVPGGVGGVAIPALLGFPARATPRLDDTSNRRLASPRIPRY